MIFTFLTASGQGGVVCVWDCAQNKLVHISGGAYCVSATLADGKLYMLRDISNFCTPYHLRVFACPFGTMDANVEGAALFADQPTKIDNYSETVPLAKLRVAKGRIVVVIGDKEITFAADENSAYTMKDEYAAYYNNGDSNLDSDILLKQGMLL